MNPDDVNPTSYKELTERFFAATSRLGALMDDRGDAEGMRLACELVSLQTEWIAANHVFMYKLEQRLRRRYGDV